MPVCEICGLGVEYLFSCRFCEVLFCTECGDTKRGLCKECAEEVWDGVRVCFKMPECEVCEESVEMIYTCKGRGLLFCKDCGSEEERICIGCLEGEIYGEY